MSQNLIPFSFESASIRVIHLDDGNWSVVAKDVCLALEYTWHHNLLSHVPDEWKGSNPITTPGGTQEMLTLTEQGLYFFLGRSDKPKALPFQKWLYGEVLPTLRKTGAYSISNHQQASASSDPPISAGMRLFAQAHEFAKTILELNPNQAKLSADVCCKKSLNLSVLGHFDITYLPANEKGQTYTPTQLGAEWLDPPASGRYMNLLLKDVGLQVKDREKHWIPTELANGYYEWVDTTKQHCVGTPIKQVRWYITVLDKMREILREREAQQQAA